MMVFLLVFLFVLWLYLRWAEDRSGRECLREIQEDIAAEIAAEDAIAKAKQEADALADAAGTCRCGSGKPPFRLGGDACDDCVDRVRWRMECEEEERWQDHMRDLYGCSCRD